MKLRNLWNYYIDEVKYDAKENIHDYYKINNNKTKASKSCECKTKIAGRTPDINNRLNTKFVVY